MIMFNQFTESTGDKKIKHTEVSSVVNVLLQLSVLVSHSNLLLLKHHMLEFKV